MKVFSLFSGIGGFDLGFQRAGMEVVAMCERDKHAQSVLRKHFPEATLYDDVREVHIERGTIDVLCGGFPCQDLSVSGKRRGLAGDRSGLWFEFARIIDEAEPAWVIIENVPGLFSSDGGRDFAVIIRWLAERGYGVGWRVLDAAGFGLAQRRKRVFIVGSFGTRSGCTLLLDAESVSGNFGARRSAGDVNPGAVENVVAIRSTSIDRVTYGNGGIAVNEPMYTLCVSDRHAVAFAGQHPNWQPSVNISPTVTTIRKNNVAYDGVLRRLTPRECERLQGFPDDWTLGQTVVQRHKQLGNAVAVPVAEWIGKRIMKGGAL